METKRLFAGVAVAATEPLRRAWTDLQREFRGESIRWTRLENLHLTVEFFGATAPERIPALAGALAAAAARVPPFELAWGAGGAFGPARHPRVLWLGVAAPGLADLHAAAAAELRAAGWTPEARPFAPHLTLGRIGRLTNARKFQETRAGLRAGSLPAQTVRELLLYESAAGRYVPLARWPLG
ncbi:MAG: RNA 2',3'-cyclic phosphodiesterase [Kiritimatiellia bacterium]